MHLPFVIDHPDSGTLKHVFHLLRSGRGGKVHIFRPLPRQQVTNSTSGYPQLKLVLLKQLCREQTAVRQQVKYLQAQTVTLITLKLDCFFHLTRSDWVI